MRGRKTNDDRADSIAFVGAVVAQVIAQGFATHAGLKTYGERVGTVREREIKSRLTMAMSMGEGDTAEALAMIAAWNEESMNAQCGDVRPVWVKPAHAVMKEIEKILSCRFNPDCMALAAASLFEVRYETRHGKLRGFGYSDNAVKRESSRTNWWKAIEGMNRKTAWYWKQKAEFKSACLWLLTLIKKNGGIINHQPEDITTLLRDDLAHAMMGKVLKVPNTSGDIRFPDEKKLAELGMESRRRRNYSDDLT